MRNSSQVSFLIQVEFAKIIIQVSWSSNLFALLILRQSTEESGLARELKSIPDLARTRTRALSPKDTTPLAAHH